MELFTHVVIVALVLLSITNAFEYSAINCRTHTASITDFGGVGDGKTLNTKAFQTAVSKLSQYSSKGGAQLIVPTGRWLTGSFNLTSHFTLFLEKGAVLLAVQDVKQWGVIPPLPSYGRGRDAAGGRYISLIFGTNLNDVVITGNNGTIDGQGAPWWEKFKQKKLTYTRPYLIEFLHSSNIQVSDITLTNGPNWHIHPTYCRDLLFTRLTIIAPVAVPNTDGINPDSCVNTKIEDCYIQSGDDCIAVKSGWDQYGIAYKMPTKGLVIRRLTCISPKSAVVALGSEMSGGIEDVRAEDIIAINSESGVRIKTGVGRGGYVKDIFVKNMVMKTMKYVFWMTGDYGSHPDDKWDPKAVPLINNINYLNTVANNVTITARLDGIKNDVFKGICISNSTVSLAEHAKKVQWNCTNVAGTTSRVTPPSCKELPDKNPGKLVSCPFPTNKLAIDTLQLKKCSTKSK